GREREIVRVRGLLRDARRELKTEGVFGDEWFGADGIWRFDVNKGRGGDEEGEVTFEEVTDGHPLIGKWTGILEREVERCGVDLRVFEGEEWERGRVDGEGGLG
ncbi:MAG: Essential protein Yae1, N terminal, partial [Pleopsidium flavum]